jgi:hypothetical protein
MTKKRAARGRSHRLGRRVPTQTSEPSLLAHQQARGRVVQTPFGTVIRAIQPLTGNEVQVS